VATRRVQVDIVEPKSLRTIVVLVGGRESVKVCQHASSFL
jgi:hypothetical protein